VEQSPIPGYELVELQQRNGHLVYLARDTNDRRLVRLSVVNSAGDFGRMVADGLRQQAAVLATLDHPNILRTLEVGDADGRGFFSALEYAGGGDSTQTAHWPLLKRAKIPTLSGALQYAGSGCRSEGSQPATTVRR
jgi:serine/threonine protein kinase